MGYKYRRIKMKLMCRTETRPVAFRALVQHRVSAYVTWPAQLDCDVTDTTSGRITTSGVAGYIFRYRAVNSDNPVGAERVHVQITNILSFYHLNFYFSLIFTSISRQYKTNRRNNYSINAVTRMIFRVRFSETICTVYFHDILVCFVWYLPLRALVVSRLCGSVRDSLPRCRARLQRSDVNLWKVLQAEAYVSMFPLCFFAEKCPPRLTGSCYP